MSIFHLGKLCLTGFVFLLLNTFVVKKSYACVDPATVITVTVNHNDDLSEIEIRLGNLKLHTETPNTFCSCALSGYTDFYTNLKYVAFMKDGTNELYPNFAPWSSETEVDNAWNISQPNSGDWKGYLGEVINDGLVTDESVELVIRASLPPGTIAVVSELDTIFATSWLGTDKWDDQNNTLTQDHQGIRNLKYDNSSITWNIVTNDYFDALDGIILADDELDYLKNNIKISPNPFSNFINLNLELENDYWTNIQLLDINGRVQQEIFQGTLSNGIQLLDIPIDSQTLPTGVYYVRLEMNNKIIIKRVIKL